MPKGLIWLLAAIVTIAAVGLLPAFIGEKEERPALAGPISAPARPRSQPGPAPAGKVWSAEHGHWHDVGPQVPRPGLPAVAGSANPSIQIQTTTEGVPPGTPLAQPMSVRPRGRRQPPGPVPAGKVWSSEHGHWHDAPK